MTFSKLYRYAILLAAMLLLTLPAMAQGPPGSGPAKVEVLSARQGILAPTATFRGTLYFTEVSEVAAEVSGKVVLVEFDEGQRVTEGQRLVRLDDTLLLKNTEALRATHNMHANNLEDARVRFDRAQALVQDGLATSEEADELRYRFQSLSYQLASTQAELERLETLIRKSTIYAPFDGVVIERQTDLGEWRREGDTVAVIAREHAFQIIVDVPEDNLRWIQIGSEASVRIGASEYAGRIETILPRGDIATRTFSVKIRIESERPIYEGMSANVDLPVGERTECVLIPRDAIINQRGENVVFTLDGKVARRSVINVLGYDGLEAGIDTAGLSADTLFIVKGHERLRDNASVEVVNAPPPSAAPRNTDD